MPAKIWSKWPNVEYDAIIFYDFMFFCFWYKAKSLIKIYLMSYTHKQKYAQTASQGLDAYLLLFLH